jgi:hypothetical protein
MIEVGLSSNVVAVAALVAVSFFCFVVGTVFRKWPEKVRQYAENVDGSVYLLSPEAHRAIILACGFALLVISFVTLLAAALFF